jgi:hypothetical protein
MVRVTMGEGEGGADEGLPLARAADDDADMSCSLSDLCSFDSFVGSRTEPLFFSLADLSTRPCVWSCDRNERLNMMAAVGFIDSGKRMN